MRRGRVTFAVDSATAVSQRARVAMIQSEIKGKRDGPILDDPEPDCALRCRVCGRPTALDPVRTHWSLSLHSDSTTARRTRAAREAAGTPHPHRRPQHLSSLERTGLRESQLPPREPDDVACAGPARKASLRDTIKPRHKTIHVDSRNAPTRFTQYGPPARRRRRRARTGRRASRRRRRADSRRGAALSCSPLYAATTRPCGRVGAFVGVAGWVSQCIHLPRGRVPCGRHRDSPRQCGSAPA